MADVMKSADIMATFFFPTDEVCVGGGRHDDVKAWLPSDEVVCNGPGLGLNQACMHEIDFPCGNAMHPCTGRCFTLLGTFHVLSSCALCTHVPPCLQAFKAVLQAGGLVLDDLLTDTKSLRAMVLYHVIEVEVSYREGGVTWGYMGMRDYREGLHGVTWE